MRCIFCKQTSDSSRSVEHVIPESIGSKRVVLPPGVVCDKCNNYFARKVEYPVLNHQSMRNVRAWYQVPNKKGKKPSLKGYVGGTDIDIAMKVEDGQLVVQAEKEGEKSAFERQKQQDIEKNTFSPYIFPIEINPPEKEMSRFLAKMALEAIAFRFMHSNSNLEIIVDEPYYDPIRKFARTGMGVKEWPYHRRVIFPMGTQMKHPETGEWVRAGFGQDLFLTNRTETYFIFLLYGVEFVINVGGPSIKGYEEWLEQNNNISPVIERVGVQLVRKTIDGEEQYFLDGMFDLGRGIEFDQLQLSGNSDQTA